MFDEFDNELFEEYGIIFDEEYETNMSTAINEVSVITGDGFSLHATPDSNYNLGEDNGYFKWINHVSFDRANLIARIKFSAPEYVYHKDGTGKANYTLNSFDKKKMIRLLSSRIPKSKLRRIPDNLIPHMHTVWNLLIYEYDKSLGFTDDDIMQYLSLDIPRSDLPKNFIRITLPMPDYNLL